MRIRSLDLARGFTVLFIAPIHTVLYFSKPYVYNTWFGQFLGFIAEDPGAQLFMLLMGISFVLSRHNDFMSVVKRSLLMLLLGYVLNFLKFVLPAMLGFLPAGVYRELQVSRDVHGLLTMLLTGDILHFAAIALLVVYFVSRLPRYPVWALVFATAICFVSPLLYDLHSSNVFTNYLLQLLGGQPPRVFFPLLPWLMYPLIGLAVGYYLKKGKPLLFGYCMLVGLILLLLSCAPWMPYAKEFNASFYRTFPSGSFYHIGIVLVWLYLAHWLSKCCADRHRLFFGFFTFLSRNITLVYIVQWGLICWTFLFFDFRELGTGWSIVLAVSMAVFTVIDTAIIAFFRKFFH